MMEYKDKFGVDIQVGDVIMIGDRQGNSGILRCGIVLELTEAPNRWRDEPYPAIKIRNDKGTTSRLHVLSKVAVINSDLFKSAVDNITEKE